MLIDNFSTPNLRLINGIIYFYDDTKNKWLSVAKEPFIFGIDNRNVVGDRWLATSVEVPSNIISVRMPRNGSITTVTAQTQNNSDCNFYIRRNGNVTNLYNLSLSTESGKTIEGLDVEINKDDYLQVLLSVNSGNVDFPHFFIEINWRK